MDALIFAAGLGTRLRPLTNDIPKALVPVGGLPMLERVALRLIDAGVDRIVINTHHFADRIEEFVRRRGGWDVDVRFSNEPDAPLETGGGLLRAAPLLRGDRPFFLHNSDILTDLPLREMYDRHLAAEAIATLAVMSRDSSRGLLFDDAGLLGRVDADRQVEIRARAPRGAEHRLAFAGVHVVSPDLIQLMSGRSGAFSILDPYMDAVRDGRTILPFRVDDYRWIDIGRAESLEEAENVILNFGV